MTRRASNLCVRCVYIFGLVILYVSASFVVRRYLLSDIQNSNGKEEIEHGRTLRKLLSVDSDKHSSNNSNSNLTERCTKPSIEEFPSDLFTLQERRYGAVFLHVLLAVYMFVALAIVCDDYFVSSLEKICEHFNLSEDVAGATFMAAGSSAPELFTAIISVFIAKGDVGLGTIVGSAVFNILVIIALCSLFAGQVIQLSWWPLCRDSFYYVLAIAALFVSLHDGSVTWYESTIMIIIYVGYIVLMKCNPKIVAFLDQRKQKRKLTKTETDLPVNAGSTLDGENQVSVTYMDGKCKYSESATEPDCDVNIEMNERHRVTWKELALMMMLTDKFSPATRFRAACLMVIHKEENRRLMQQAEGSKGATSQTIESDVDENAGIEEEEEEDEESVLVFPSGSPIRCIYWLITLPLVVLMYATIPDCRKQRWEKWWPATFFFSIFWIMVFSYIMVWMVVVIGFTIGVPDVIMGIIFLAAGTSIPDAISSLLVAREGMGDMAVSNSIGSNIFDILIGLALPWFIKSAIYNPGKPVPVNSRGMQYSVVLLFASVVLTVLSIYYNKWCLDRKLGLMLTALYFVFITLSACIEFNIFTYVNFPVCPYDG